jgi:hypothetical protein
MAKFEVNDASAAGTTTAAAAAAHANLLNEFIDNSKSPVTGNKVENAKPSAQSSESSPSTLGKSLLEGIANGTKPKDIGNSAGSAVGEALKDAMKKGGSFDGIENGASPREGYKNESGKNIADMLKDYTFEHRLIGPVTDKDRANAKAELGRGVSELIPDGDKAILKQMQGALIDGNVDSLKESLNKLADDPAKMEKFIKEVNGQLKKAGASLEMGTDSKGNVLVYDRNGNTAVSINAKSGETTLRAVERQSDGSVVLKPGEIINRKTADVMKSLGDDATRDMTQPRFKSRGILEDQLQELMPKRSLLDGMKGMFPEKFLHEMERKNIEKNLQNLIPENKRKEK